MSDAVPNRASQGDADRDIRLQALLAKAMRDWNAMFPEVFFQELARLTGHADYAPGIRPRYWGKIINELVYSYLQPELAEWLQTHNPNPRFRRNHHQFLSEPYGTRLLHDRIMQLVGMMQICYSITELRMRLAEIHRHMPVQLTLVPPPSQPRKGRRRKPTGQKWRQACWDIAN